MSAGATGSSKTIGVRFGALPGAVMTVLASVRSCASTTEIACRRETSVGTWKRSSRSTR